jgi:hypothetical protein
MTNKQPQVLLTTLAEGELQKARKFISSRYQSELMSKLHDYQGSNNIFDRLYTRLVYMGWNSRDGMEQETATHRRHNINTNFDVIEINGPYFQATQEAINFLVNKEIKEQIYDDGFISEIKADFRLYDPTDPLIVTESRPSVINRVDTTLSNDQFLGFEDMINLSDGWKLFDDDWITLYESGHQRVGDSYTSDTKQICYFTFVSFLVSSDWENNKLDLMPRLKTASPFIYLENIYRHELPYILPHGKSFPISGVRPIIGVSKRAFRGQDELSIAALLPDFADEIQVVPTYTLSYERNGETLARLFQWQEKYDQNRRRQKPVAAGIRLQIQKQMLQDYLEKGQWSIHYIFHSRRSTDKYAPEEEMNWANFDRIGKLKLPVGSFSWLP